MTSKSLLNFLVEAISAAALVFLFRIVDIKTNGLTMQWPELTFILTTLFSLTIGLRGALLFAVFFCIQYASELNASAQLDYYEVFLDPLYARTPVAIAFMAFWAGSYREWVRLKASRRGRLQLKLSTHIEELKVALRNSKSQCQALEKELATALMNDHSSERRIESTTHTKATSGYTATISSSRAGAKVAKEINAF